MTTHEPDNERVKRRYFAYLKEAKRHSEPAVDAVAKALARFEVDTRHRNSKAFHFEQAIAFERHLAEQNAQRSGEIEKQIRLALSTDELEKQIRLNIDTVASARQAPAPVPASTASDVGESLREERKGDGGR